MSQLKTIQDENPSFWLPQLAAHGGPRFLQIADALQAAVMVPQDVVYEEFAGIGV